MPPNAPLTDWGVAWRSALMALFWLAVVVLLGALGGCETPEQARARAAELQRQAAAEDHAWCEGIGIPAADDRYALCRTVARQLREQRAADLRRARQARSDALLGTGLGLMSLGQPRPAPVVTCSTLGRSTTCY